MPANEKISQLANLLAVNTADNDLLAVVDVSAGITKKQTYYESMIKIKSMIDSYIPSVLAEEPAGDYDGINTVFELQYAPINSSLELIYNGIILRQGIDDDYTLSETTITMAVAPYLDDSLIANYSYSA